MAVDKDGNEIVTPTPGGNDVKPTEGGDDKSKLDTKGPSPAIDATQMEQIKTMVNQGVASAIQELVKEPEAPVATPSMVAPTAGENPLRDAIQPIIEPALQRVNIIAEAAKDAALFYSTNEEAHGHRKEIEAAFDKLVTQGTPFTREAVWEWYRGKNFDKFHQKANEADKKKLEDATQAQTIDGAGRPVVGSVQQVTIDTPDDQLDKALEGQNF